MKITNSKQKSYQRCKNQYHYKFEENLAPKITGVPAKRGTWLHELLQAHYLTGDWKKRHKELTAEFNQLFDEEKDHYGDLPSVCRQIMRSYAYNYREEDSELTVIAAEEEVEVPLPHGHTMGFKFDMIAEDEYGRWLWEHKSHASIPGADYRFTDTQTNKYVWGLNKIKKYGKIMGVCWNYMLTKPPTVPKLNKDGTLSKRKINTDLFTFVTSLKNYGLALNDYRDVILRLKGRNDFFRRERVPITPAVVKQLIRETVIVADEIERGFEPVRTIDRSCETFCSYMELCMVELYGGDADMVRKAKYDVRKAGDYYGDQIEATQI